MGIRSRERPDRDDEGNARARERLLRMLHAATYGTIEPPNQPAIDGPQTPRLLFARWLVQTGRLSDWKA